MLVETVSSYDEENCVAAEAENENGREGVEGGGNAWIHTQGKIRVI